LPSPASGGAISAAPAFTFVTEDADDQLIGLRKTNPLPATNTTTSNKTAAIIILIEQPPFDFD
jgi:hypothetical protein